MRLDGHLLFWLIVAAAVGVALAVLSPILLPFVAGLVLAYFLNPVVDRLASASVPRALAAIVIIVGFVSAIVVAVVFLSPIVIEQADGLITALPSELSRLRTLVEETARERLGSRFPEAQAALTRTLAGLSDSLPALLAGIAATLWSHGAAAFNFLALMLITPLVMFYALLDWPKMIATIDSWLPRDRAPALRRVAIEINERISAFIRGQGAVCLLLAAFYAVALSALQLRYGLLVGLLTGLSSFVPFVGWALGLVTSLSIATVQFWPDTTPFLLVLGVFLAGQALDAAVLGPNIVGSKVGLHPVWLIFALVAFSYLFGFLGLLVAVPLAAAIGVIIRFGFETYRGSAVYQGLDGA